MARPPSPVRCPVVNLEHDWQAEPAGNLQSHFLSVVRQAREETLGTGVLYRTGVVGALCLYRRLRERPPDALTTGRLVGELTRTLRTLGLTGRIHLPVAGRRPGQPAKRQIPRARVQASGAVEFRDEDDDGADDV